MSRGKELKWEFGMRKWEERECGSGNMKVGEKFVNIGIFCFRVLTKR
jgi:hypothetical protein